MWRVDVEHLTQQKDGSTLGEVLPPSNRFRCVVGFAMSRLRPTNTLGGERVALHGSVGPAAVVARGVPGVLQLPVPGGRLAAALVHHPGTRLSPRDRGVDQADDE